MRTQGNLNVIGDSALSGGSFDKVRVMGALSLSESLAACHITVVGDLQSAGPITCDELRVAGTARMGRLAVRKKASVMGQVAADNIEAEAFEIRGEVVCRNNLECKELKVLGAVDVENLLSADWLFIKTKYLCRAAEIGGKSLKVRPALLSGKIVLSAQIIEFDEIDIDCVQAEIVRGRNIVIGKNCRIGKVEYIDSLTQHPEAHVARAVLI